MDYGRAAVDEVAVAAPVHDHRGELVSAVMFAARRSSAAIRAMVRRICRHRAHE